MIIKKKKGDRVYYNIRKNEPRNKKQDGNWRNEEGKDTSVIMKQHFDYDMLKQIGLQNNQVMSLPKSYSRRKYDNREK